MMLGFKVNKSTDTQLYLPSPCSESQYCEDKTITIAGFPSRGSQTSKTIALEEWEKLVKEFKFLKCNEIILMLCLVYICINSRK